MSSDEEIISAAVAKAQEDARRDGFTSGQTIAHPDDRLIYEFVRVENKDDQDVAIVHLPASYSKTGEEVNKSFPLAECFDPNRAMDYVRGDVHIVMVPF